MKLERHTAETRIHVALELSPGISRVDSRMKFLNHMLITLGHYAGWTLSVEAEGDLRHHLIEDVALTLGTALKRCLPEQISRFGSGTAVMDDALVLAAVDVGGRAWYEGPVPSSLYDHFFRSFCEQAGMTLHIDVRRGRDRHHVIEAAFKSAGLALREALSPSDATVSTKGSVRIEEVFAS